MALDQPEEHVVEPNGTEKDNLTIITPDENEQAPPPATDCTWADIFVLSIEIALTNIHR
jgi:hypothetical protein